MKNQVLRKAQEITQKWFRDESGAVTADWVLLLAGLITLSVLVMSQINPSVEQLAQRTGDHLTTIQPGTI